MATGTKPKTKRARRRRLDPAERREELLEAVEAVVSKHGYGATTVPRVVAEAGIAQGSFYRYFADIDEAFLELARRVLAPIAEAALALDFSNARTAQDVERELREAYRAIASQLAAHPAVIHEALLVGPSAPGPVGAELSAFLGEMRAHARALLEGYAGRGPFRTGDARVGAAAVVSMIMGAAHEAIHLGDEFEPELWAKEMARFETGALVKPSAWASGRRKGR